MENCLYNTAVAVISVSDVGRKSQEGNISELREEVEASPCCFNLVPFGAQRVETFRNIVRVVGDEGLVSVGRIYSNIKVISILSQIVSIGVIMTGLGGS